jgi:hypothetical protein
MLEHKNLRKGISGLEGIF